MICGLFLPEHCCKDDEQWITGKLADLPQKVRKKVAQEYSNLYLEEYNKELVQHKKENKARRAANTRLRKYVERYSSVMKCKVNEPPTAE